MSTVETTTTTPQEQQVQQKNQNDGDNIQNEIQASMTNEKLFNLRLFYTCLAASCCLISFIMLAAGPSLTGMYYLFIGYYDALQIYEESGLSNCTILAVTDKQCGSECDFDGKYCLEYYDFTVFIDNGLCENETIYTDILGVMGGGEEGCERLSIGRQSVYTINETIPCYVDDECEGALFDLTPTEVDEMSDTFATRGLMADIMTWVGGAFIVISILFLCYIRGCCKSMFGTEKEE